MDGISITYLLGADLARLGQDCSVFIIIKQEEEVNKVVFIKELKKNTMDQAIDYILYLHNRFSFAKIVCDSTGLGAGVVDVLAKKLNAHKTINPTNYNQRPNDNDIVVGVTFTQKNKMDIFSNLKLLMEQGKLLIPNNKKLIYQLKDFRYETTESGNLKLHHSEGGHDDFVDALACACHGIRGKQVGWFFG
jgi:phage FluMu gp28-like protein